MSKAGELNTKLDTLSTNGMTWAEGQYKKLPDKTKEIVDRVLKVWKEQGRKQASDALSKEIDSLGKKLTRWEVIALSEIIGTLGKQYD